MKALAEVFKAGHYELPLNAKTYIMGILNVTPDSFSDGKLYLQPDKAISRAIEMQSMGADIIDVGAQSTRPGYTEVSAREELGRLTTVLEGLKGKLRVPISVDTYYPEVAKKALQYGASIINDVHGFQDERMFELASKSDCGCVVMHSGPIKTAREFFCETLKKADKYDIDRSRFCFDPGIGFGKTYEENISSIKNIDDYKIEKTALLIGLSRKSVIGIASGDIEIKDRLYGTIAANTIAVMKGVNIIRVHDVKEAVRAFKVVDSVLRG